jgi:hypothetical protein
MLDREALLPLVIGAVIAVLVNLLLLPAVGQMDAGAGWQSLRHDRGDKPMLESPPEIRYGTDDGRASSVSWIPYASYEELVAPKSKQEQPAVQQEVDPVPDAPVTPDPTPPTAPSQARDASQPTPPEAGEHPPLPPEGDVAVDRLAPPAPTTPEPQPVQTPQPPAADAGGRPTSAPRVDRDADPVRITDSPLPVRPGEVIAAEGIEIKTARAQFSLTTQLTAIPVNPVVSITFDVDGRVIEAKVLRSSGYADVDGPLLTSLYRWRAEGEAFQRLGTRFTGEWRIILVGE